MEEIKSKEDYLRPFAGNEEDALRRVEQIRNLEADLYWRRADYFWAFSAAAFTGFFVLKNSKNPDNSSLVLVSCLGAAFSFVWYLANRGGKYWHNNWGQQVEILEDVVSGPIFKTNIKQPKIDILKPLVAYPFSVDKLNHMLSLFITVIWWVLIYQSAVDAKLGLKGSLTCPGLFILLTIIFIISSLIFGRSNPKDNKINMTRRQNLNNNDDTK